VPRSEPGDSRPEASCYRRRPARAPGAPRLTAGVPSGFAFVLGEAFWNGPSKGVGPPPPQTVPFGFPSARSEPEWYACPDGRWVHRLEQRGRPPERGVASESSPRPGHCARRVTEQIQGRTDRVFVPEARQRAGSRGGRGAGRGCPKALGGVLTAAEGRGLPGRLSGRGESRTSDGTHQRVSWGGEVAGARGRGLEGSRRCSRMARAVVERRTTATTRRVPPQRGQVRTSDRKVRPRSSAQGMGRRGGRWRRGSGVTGQEAASASGAGTGGAGTTRGRTRALGAKTPK
jgi:hypothetical protein